MSADPRRENLVDTVPPPKGAEDPYSATTRVGTLPENVLSAMRAQAVPAEFEAMEAPTRPQGRPPPLPPRAREALQPLAVLAIGPSGTQALPPFAAPPPPHHDPFAARESAASFSPSPLNIASPHMAFYGGHATYAPVLAPRRRRATLWSSLIIVAACGILGALTAVAIALAIR